MPRRLSEEELKRLGRSITVCIETENGIQGTGWVVSVRGDKSLIVTNAHVVADGREKRGVVFHDISGSKAPWRLVVSNRDKRNEPDIALIESRLPASVLPDIATISERNAPIPGSAIFSFGYPAGVPKYSWGAFPQLKDMAKRIKNNIDELYWLKGPSGTSGSAVLDEYGHVTGLHNSGHILIKKRCFCVPPILIRQFLDSHGVSYKRGGDVHVVGGRKKNRPIYTGLGGGVGGHDEDTDSVAGTVVSDFPGMTGDGSPGYGPASGFSPMPPNHPPAAGYGKTPGFPPTGGYAKSPAGYGSDDDGLAFSDAGSSSPVGSLSPVGNPKSPGGKGFYSPPPPSRFRPSVGAGFDSPPPPSRFRSSVGAGFDSPPPPSRFRPSVGAGFDSPPSFRFPGGGFGRPHSTIGSFGSGFDMPNFPRGFGNPPSGFDSMFSGRRPSRPHGPSSSFGRMSGDFDNMFSGRRPSRPHGPSSSFGRFPTDMDDLFGQSRVFPCMYRGGSGYRASRSGYDDYGAGSRHSRSGSRHSRSGSYHSRAGSSIDRWRGTAYGDEGDDYDDAPAPVAHSHRYSSYNPYTSHASSRRNASASGPQQPSGPASGSNPTPADNPYTPSAAVSAAQAKLDAIDKEVADAKARLDAFDNDPAAREKMIAENKAKYLEKAQGITDVDAWLKKMDKHRDEMDAKMDKLYPGYATAMKEGKFIFNPQPSRPRDLPSGPPSRGPPLGPPPSPPLGPPPSPPSGPPSRPPLGSNAGEDAPPRNPRSMLDDLRGGRTDRLPPSFDTGRGSMRGPAPRFSTEDLPSPYSLPAGRPLMPYPKPRADPKPDLPRSARPPASGLLIDDLMESDKRGERPYWW